MTYVHLSFVDQQDHLIEESPAKWVKVQTYLFMLKDWVEYIEFMSSSNPLNLFLITKHFSFIKLLYVFVFMAHEVDQIAHCGVTMSLTAVFNTTSVPHAIQEMTMSY